MSSEIFSQVANADQATAKGLWADIQIAAYQQLHTDVFKLFQNRYKLRSVARSINIGSKVDKTAMVATSNVYRGFGVDSDSGIDSDYTRSHLLGISVDSLQLFISEVPEGEIGIAIWDADTDEPLFTRTINNEGYTLTANSFNTIPVNLIFSSKHIRFGFTHRDIETPSLNLPLKITQNLHACMCDWYGFDCNTYKCPGRVYGFTTQSETDLTIDSEGTNTYGLTATINFVCSYENLICKMKMQFKEAWWYLLGWMSYEYELKGNSFTRRSTITKEDSKVDQDEMYKAYMDKLTILINGIDLNTSDICLECNGQIRKEYVTP